MKTSIKKVEIPLPPSIPMKTLINESLQNLQICILKPGQNEIIRLRPRESISIPASQVSQMAKNLAKRKLIKIVDNS